MAYPLNRKRRTLVCNPCIVQDSFVVLVTAAGKHIKIDHQDYELVKQYRWQASEKQAGTGRFYAIAHDLTFSSKRHTKKVQLHRLHKKPGVGLVVDHINGDPLDNRRQNLRVCTQKQNSANTRATVGTSKYKGVHYDKSRKKWKTEIKTDSCRRHIGRFKTEAEAAAAYDKAAKEVFGEFAKTNGG